MNSRFKIRRAILKDLETITQFNYNLAKETEDLELNKETVTRGVKSLLDDSKKGQYYVCTRDDEVIGQLMTTYEWSDWRNGTFLWIQSVYVDKAYRGKGVFKALFNHVKEISDNDESIVGLRLYVEVENNTAKNTYKSLGMQQCKYNMFEYEK